MTAYKKEGCDEHDFAGAAFREALRMRDEIMGFVGKIQLPLSDRTKKGKIYERNELNGLKG